MIEGIKPIDTGTFMNTNKAQESLYKKARWFVAYFLISFVVIWVGISLFFALYGSGWFGAWICRIILAYFIMSVCKDKIKKEIDKRVN